jgi:hypothetical protein
MHHAHSSAAAAAGALRALKLKCARQQLLRAQTARATAAATAATAAGSTRRNADTHSDSGSDSGDELVNSSGNNKQREVAALASQLEELRRQRSAGLTAKAAAEVRCERAEADLAQVCTVLCHLRAAYYCSGFA